MSIFSKVSNRISKALGGTVDAFSTWTPFGIGSYNKTELLKQNVGLVYTCISAITEDVGKYNPIFTSPVSNKTITNHPFLTLLKNPNPETTQYEFFESMQTYLELTGDTYIYVVLGEVTRRPKKLIVLRSDLVKPAVDDVTGKTIGYAMRRADGEHIPFDLDEIIHIKHIDPVNRSVGLSKIQAGILPIETEKYTSLFQRNFLKNQATPSGILTVNGKISTEAFKKIQLKWRESNGGIDNAGKTLFIKGVETKFEKLGLSLSDLNMEAIKRMSKEDVLQLFRVPEAILGKTDSNGLGRANIEAIEYIFAKRTIEPKLTRFDDMFTKKIKEYYKDDIVVSHKSQIPEDDAMNLQEDSLGVDRWVTRNEVRIRRGLKPIDGGDKLYLTFNQVDLDGSVSEATKGLGTITLKAKKKDVKKKQSPIYVNMLKIEKRSTNQYKKGMKKLVNDQQDQILEILRNNTKDLVTTVDLINFNLVFSKEELELNLLPALMNAIEEAGKAGIDLYGEPDQDFLFNQAQREAIFRNTESVSKNFNRETSLKIQKQMAAGLKDGEDYEQLSKRVKTVYSDAKDYRINTLAKTEAHNATNEAFAESFRQTGYSKHVWRNNPDACDFCRQMEGTVVTIGSPFVVQGDSVQTEDGKKYVTDYQDVKYGNLHPNCNCYTEPVK